MLSEFRTATATRGERALSTEKRILHIEEQGDDATAILFRHA